ncbi:hypothetical protein P7C73_g4862, partial [Tremellales sp. Uapishka_1]
MPYADPTSPSPSPSKDFSQSRKGIYSPPTHIEDANAWSPSPSGPMPGIPRRSSSNHSSGSTTPRKALSPSMSRTASSSYSTPMASGFPTSKPMEGLPRRTNSQSGLVGVAGLPSHNTSPTGNSNGLGLKLHHQSPSKALPTLRGVKDSMSSVSTADSSLPGTPADGPHSLPNVSAKDNAGGVPFPTFQPSQEPTQVRGPMSRAASARPPLLSTRKPSALSNGHHRGGAAQTGSLQIDFPASASTSNLTPQDSQDSYYLCRPTSMIRKKSGEVVKPSLKVRSMSTPDLTRLESSDSPTPEIDDGGYDHERSKSVRFAGGDEDSTSALESVVLFLTEQKVTAVSKAADPNSGTMTETETEGEDLEGDYVQFRTKRNAAAQAADETEKISFGEGGSRVPRVRVDFAPDARGSLTGENVVLERVELQNGSGALAMRGTVIVRNLSFQKWVAVRFTLDHWQTVSEVSGTHVCHIPSATTGDEGWDRFSFVVKLEDYKRKLDEKRLLLCVRFSIDGREWWDSNAGQNYGFTFKKTAPNRPTRAVGTSAALSGAIMRMNDMRVSDSSSPALPGLRNRGPSTVASDINRAFGSSPLRKPLKSWVYPVAQSQPARSDSPVQSPPPAVAFQPPGLPDARSHLQLANYCAPSPPLSPLTTKHGLETALPSGPAAQDDQTGDVPRRQSMFVQDGHHASEPIAPGMGHERRRSWGGQSGSWDSFATVMSKAADSNDATPTRDGGDVTPTKARSPESSPEQKPLSMKRSSGDLRSLVDTDSIGLMTPPSSNLSSPPSPALTILPAIPSSPSPSGSTGESSPVNTISSDSIPDLAAINTEERGRTLNPNSYKQLSNNYQEFLDKFCFFQSPSMTPSLDAPVYSRPSFVPQTHSGYNSPNGFPFYPTPTGSTPTPTRHLNPAHDGYDFPSSTPRSTPPVDPPTLWKDPADGPPMATA